MSDASLAFVKHGLSADWDKMPAPARAAVKTFLLDTIGVGVAGAGAPVAAPVRAAARKWAGEGAAHVWGQGTWSTTSGNAAYVNAFQIHCQEFDCVHEPAVVHPLATILAALSAEADASGFINGRDFGTALAVSVDFAVGLGVAATSPIRFFRPATAGLFGATLGVARLRGFDVDRTRHALGYALAFCSGTMQAHVEGKPALPVQIANAARSALYACDLAGAGMEGPRDVLEGPYGYFSLFEESWDLAPVISALGREWRIAEVSHKPFPTGRAAQGGIVLMQKLRRHGIDPGDVDRIELTAPPLIKRLVGRPLKESMTANYARLCFQYSGAVAYLRGAVGLANFHEDALSEDAVLAFGRRIVVVDDGTDDPAAFTPQTVRLVSTSGAEITESITALYGAPADPLNEDANREKFRQCVAFGFHGAEGGMAEDLITYVDQLEQLEDVSVLSRLASGQEI